MVTPAIKDEMENLLQVISQTLRSNDIFTQSSPSQYSLIASVSNKDGYKRIIERIQENYEPKKRHTEVTLTIEATLIY